MNFLADECCDAGLVAALRADGHDVLFAVEDLRGSSDEDLLRQAFAEDRILLTEDKDFGELVHAGVSLPAVWSRGFSRSGAETRLKPRLQTKEGFPPTCTSLSIASTGPWDRASALRHPRAP